MKRRWHVADPHVHARMQKIRKKTFFSVILPRAFVRQWEAERSLAALFARRDDDAVRGRSMVFPTNPKIPIRLTSPEFVHPPAIPEIEIKHYRLTLTPERRKR